MANAGYNIKVRIHTETIESAIGRILDKKKDIILSDNLKRTSAELYMDKIKHLVPLGKTEELRSSADIRPYKDTYAVCYDPVDEKRDIKFHYGEVQYNGPDWWNRRTEGTYSHWNQHLSSFEREDYYRELAKLYVEECNNG